jgi:tRNA dimethylallyltransferase
MCGVPHHLVDFLPLEKSFSVADYAELARAEIADIYSRKKLPILCGGTGLYISSLIDNIQFDDTGADPELRMNLERFAEREGKHALWERLNEIDPDSAAQIHENNLIRVIRAIEVYERTGVTLSQQKINSRRCGTIYNTCIIQIDFHDRAKLYERINQRVDLMMQNGMLDEAKRIYEGSDPATAYQAIGYKELVPYLEGKAELSECVEKIKQETRRYAKRQLTWFRKMENVTTVYPENSKDYKNFLENVQNTIAKSEILCYNKE